MAAWGEDSELAQLFQSFAGGERMDNRCFLKCLKETGLLNSGKLRPVEADLVFARLRPKGSRKIDFALFRQALGMIAQKLEVSEACLLACLRPAAAAMPSCAGSGISKDRAVGDQGLASRSRISRQNSAPVPRMLGDEGRFSPPPRRQRSQSREASRESSFAGESLVGPERFFYDKSTYTGTHRNGGPDVLGNGRPKRDLELSDVVQRECVLDDELHRRKKREDAKSSRESTPDRRNLPMLLGQPTGGQAAAPGRKPLPRLLGAPAADTPVRKQVEPVCRVEPPVSDRPAAPANTPSAREAAAVEFWPGSGRAEFSPGSGRLEPTLEASGSWTPCTASIPLSSRAVPVSGGQAGEPAVYPTLLDRRPVPSTEVSVKVLAGSGPGTPRLLSSSFSQEARPATPLVVPARMAAASPQAAPVLASLRRFAVLGARPAC